MRHQMRSVWIVIAMLSLCVVTTHYAIAQATPLISLETAQGIITQAIADICGENVQKTTISFERMVSIVIALDLTKGWESEQGVKIIDALKNDADRYQKLQSIRKLLQGDTTGATELFANKMTQPDFSDTARAITALRGNGYSLAANALETLNPDLSGTRITAWLRIPADQRRPIDDFMLQRYHPSSMNRQALVDIAWKLYTKPPADGLPADAYFDFALWFGKDTGTITFGTAYLLNQDKNPQGAIKLVKWLAGEQPDDASVQRSAADAFMSYQLPPQELIAFYQEAINRSKEPFAREIRLDYYELIKRKRLVPEDESLATIQQGKDLLRAGDAFLVEAQYPQAAGQFRAVLTDVNVDINHRAAAWSGLLDSDPTSALANTDKLLGDLEGMKDSVARAKLVVWCGWQFHRLVDREVPLPPGQYRVATRMEYRPIREVPQWQNQIATFMERILKIDDVACLTPGKNNQPSLRYTAALIFSLAGDGKKAAEIAKREIKYLAPPPAGGWTIFPGTPDKDADKPREQISPRAGETERLMNELMAAISRYNTATQTDPTAPITTLPPNLELMGLQCSTIDMCSDKEKIKPMLIEFGEQFALAVAHIDPMRKGLRLDQPPPAPREVSLEPIAYLLARLRVTFRQDFACHYVPWFLYGGQPYGGMLRAMMTASNPVLLNNLFDMTVEVLDKYQQAEGAENAAIAAETMASYLDGRKVYDMTKYSKQLRERYPKPDVKKE